MQTRVKKPRQGGKGTAKSEAFGGVWELMVRQLLFAALGALVGSATLLFGVRPFGVALASAATVPAVAVGIGAAVLSVAVGDLPSLVGVALALLARILLCAFLKKKDVRVAWLCEPPPYRVLIASGAVLIVGFYRLAQGGFRFYDLFGLLLAVAATALAALLFCGLFECGDRLLPHSKDAGVTALLLTCIFALRTVTFFGVYPSAVAAALFAFLAVTRRGVSAGAIGGLLAGLCFDYRLAPAFLLCGLCFGLLEKSSRGGAVLSGGGAAAIYAFALRGIGGVSALLPALLTAGAVFLAGDSIGVIEGAPGYRLAARARRASAQSARAEEQTASALRLKGLAEAFSGLSDTLYELSNRMRRPALADLRHLCDKAFDSVCPGCRHREVCWGSEYHDTARVVGDMGSRLQDRGAVDAAQIPQALAARCVDLPRILQEINEGTLRLSERALRGDKTSVVAADYAAMGRLLEELLADSGAEYLADAALGERILERLQRLGYTVESVAVCGNAHRRVILRGIRLPGRHLKMRDLRRILEQHCHFRLGAPVICECDGAQDVMFPECCALQVKMTKACRAKGKGESRYCGDSVAALSTDQGLSYAFLCDGMGSGNSAALTSVLASTFLSELLRVGCRADTALRMLNGFLAARGERTEECSTTVDLLEIDCVSKEASLLKCGAATTFLLRRGELSCFSSRTTPLGILETLDAERLCFSVESGDVILQVSDGVTKGEERCPWLEEMLLAEWKGDGEAFARSVLARAACRGDDDVSVLVSEVCAASLGSEETSTAASA